MVEFLPQIDEIVDRTDPELVFLAIDTAHVGIGADPADVIRRHHSRVRHVHLKDLDFAGNFTVLGDGIIVLHGVYDVLLEMAYDGWLVTELDVPLGSPYDTAKRNLEFARALVPVSDSDGTPRTVP